MEAPPTTEEYVSAFGPIKAVRVPHAIHDTLLKARLHHLGDFVNEDGTLKLTRRMLQGYIPDRAAGYFIKWFRKYQDDLKDCLDDVVLRWQGALKTWTVPPPGHGSNRDSGWGPPGKAGEDAEGDTHGKAV